MKIYQLIPGLSLLYGHSLLAAPLGVDVVQKPKNEQLLDEMLTPTEVEKSRPSAVVSPAPVATPTARLMDISLVLNTAAGASTATDAELSTLQSGAHDPRRRGFTFQGAELSASGAVDPYFNAEMHAVFSESAVELEEAFLTTTSLPWNFQMEAGYFLTEFGRNNPRHTHEWDFIDQPLTVGRMFGGEGQRGAGAMLTGVLPTSWFSEWVVSLQSPKGGLTSSFLSSETSTIGGRPTVERETQSMEDMIALLRWANGGALSRSWEMQVGLNAMGGPNSTGQDSSTQLLGADFVLRWASLKQRQGYPFFRLEGEFVQREFEAASGVNKGLVYNETELKDWAALLQAIYGFKPHWSAGLRYEQAGGEGASYAQLRSQDPNRSDRQRISPIVTYRPSEFSKVSLQYNHDNVDHLKDTTQHSVWLSLQVLIGTHPAHNF